MNLIELHILQSFPVSCLNRDDVGSHKSALFGGVLPDREPTTLETFDYQEEAEDGVFFQSDQPVAYGAHHGSVPAPYRARGLRQHRHPAS